MSANGPDSTLSLQADLFQPAGGGSSLQIHTGGSNNIGPKGLRPFRPVTSEVMKAPFELLVQTQVVIHEEVRVRHR